MNKRHMTLHFMIMMFIFLTLMSADTVTVIVVFAVWLIHPETLYKAAPLALIGVAFLTSMVLGFSISIVTSKYLLRPVNDFKTAFKKIGKGDFSVRLKTSDKQNEINDLRSSFNNMADELGSTEIFRNDFINNFSHEFKTPIVSIKGFANQLQKDNISEEQRKKYINIIADESDRLASMASNILLLSRFENLQIVTDKTVFYLDEQIRNAILLLEKQWSKKNIELDLQLDEVIYYSNEEMMSHIWINLLSNAIKFSNDYGKITVKCYRRSSHISIKISDNGSGMDDRTQQHIFDKFYQGDSSHKSQGNGLGLSLVKRVTDLCGGKIFVKSQVGKGTTFSIHLPITMLPDEIATGKK